MKWFLTVFCSLYLSLCFAQSIEFLRADTSDQKKDMPRYIFTQVKYHHGIHITTGVEELQETVESNPYNAFDARVGWRGYGRKAWNRFFRNKLSYGVGLNYAVFKPYENILGNPFAVYFFMEYPLFRNDWIWFGIDFGVGGSIGFKPYDPNDNPDQRGIGSRVNVFFEPQLELGLKLTERLDFSVGGGLTHYSNARSRTPNKGVNLLGVQGKVTYNIKPFYKDDRDPSSLPARLVPIRRDHPKHQNYFEFMAAIGGGFVGTNTDYEINDPIYYGAFSSNFDVAYRYSHILRTAIGYDVFYDQSMSFDYEGVDHTEVPHSDMVYSGIHISQELLIHRWAILFQYGRTFGNVPLRESYVIAGFRYDVTPNFFLKGYLKTPTELVADFAQLCVGYTFKTRKLEY